jgi:SAM-dependent methyltransferase
MRIADYGCGPGNILWFLKGRIANVTGIDSSKRALAISQEKASNFGITFNPVEKNIIDYTPTEQEKFDIIISVNSILPSKREDVVLMLKSIRRGMKSDAKLLATLPSFDTVEKLLEYWTEVFAKRSNNYTDYVDRCVKAIRIKKKMDSHDSSFADDGVHRQCFHTLKTIETEFKEAGLQLVRSPEKIHYPWEMAQRFDYGFFPGKEEIWDWFVVAKKN